MKGIVLVDANVLLDIFTDDPKWKDWSRKNLRSALLSGGAAVNPIIYAEVSLAFEHQSDLEKQLRTLTIRKLELPYEAAFEAGKAFINYRRKGGQKRSPLPDFYIGAHAAVAKLVLLTRDSTRYRSYFPQIKLIAHQ